MHSTILEKRDQIVLACRRLNVTRLDLFGSAARMDDFDLATSDADFLVSFRPGTAAEAFFDLKATFEQILGRHVDLLDRQAIETSRNYIRRRHILSEAELIYVA